MNAVPRYWSFAEKLVGCAPVFKIEGLHDSRFESDNASGVFDDVDKVLKCLKICWGRHVAGLVEVVELLLGLMDGMRKVLLALIVEGYLLDCL